MTYNPTGISMKNIKNVLLFSRANINHNSLNVWINNIEKQLNKYDIKTHIISMADSETKISSNLQNILSNHKIDAAIAVNAIGQQNWKVANSNKSVWDLLHIPFVNWIVDHPLEHVSDLISTTANYNVICVDQNHELFIKKHFPSIRKSYFLPLGGLMDDNSKDIDFSSFKKREYDIVLAAGLMEPDEIKKQLLSLPDDIKCIALKWTDYMEKNISLPPELSLRKTLFDMYSGLEPPEELFISLAKICSPAVFYIRTWIRKEIVQRLMDSGIEFHLFGTGWEHLNSLCPNSKAILHGDIPITETIPLMQNTKLAINILPMFKAGSHDRIATAQLNGAAVFTDSNLYIDQIYSENEIFKFDIENITNIPIMIESLLSDENQLYTIAKNGQRKAKISLSWDCIGKQLISIIEDIINS